MVRFRVGRKVGRTIYVQLGPEPSDGDHLVGMLETREQAEAAVRGLNEDVGIEADDLSVRLVVAHLLCPKSSPRITPAICSA